MSATPLEWRGTKWELRADHVPAEFLGSHVPGKESWELRGSKGSSPRVFSTSPRPSCKVTMQHNAGASKHYFIPIPTSGLGGNKDIVGSKGSHHLRPGRCTNPGRRSGGSGISDGRPLKQELFITVSRALMSVQNRGPEDTGMQQPPWEGGSHMTR